MMSRNLFNLLIVTIYIFNIVQGKKISKEDHQKDITKVLGKIIDPNQDYLKGMNKERQGIHTIFHFLHASVKHYHLDQTSFIYVYLNNVF